MKLLRRLFKTLLVLMLIAGLGAGALVLWLRYYVQTPEFAANVKTLGSELAGGAFDFDHLQWDIGRGLTVENIRLERNGSETGGEPAASMQAWQIILKYDWASLWCQQFEITRLTFKTPRFIIRQQEDGSFLLPFAPVPGRVDPPGSPISAVLSAFNLDNGELRVLRGDGSPLLEFFHFQAEGQKPEGSNGNGALNGVGLVSRVLFWGEIKMQNLRSPYRFQQDNLELNAVQASFYGGQLSGQWQQRLSEDDLPYSAKLDASGVEIGPFLKDAVGVGGLLTGKLNVKSTWIGPAKRPLDVSGEGSLSVSQGRILDIPLFRTLAERLPGMQVLAQPDFSVLSAEYTIANRQVEFTSLEMKSTLFEINGQATVGFDHTVTADLVLAVNPRLANRLPEEATNLMETREDGYRTFIVSVAGTLQRPSVGIPVSDALRERAIEGLQRFLGPIVPAMQKSDEKASPQPTGEAGETKD